MWRGKRSFLSFFAQLYSYSSVAFVIFWILSLRPKLSGSEWAQRVPLGCFVAGTVGGGPSGLCWSAGVGCGGPTACAGLVCTEHEAGVSLWLFLMCFTNFAFRVTEAWQTKSCLIGWYSQRWSLWAVLVWWCRLWWSHCLCWVKKSEANAQQIQICGSKGAFELLLYWYGRWVMPLGCTGFWCSRWWSHWAMLVWFATSQEIWKLGADARLISIESVLYRMFFQSGLWKMSGDGKQESEGSNAKQALSQGLQVCFHRLEDCL